MLELTTPHLDDFTMLRYVADDLDADSRSDASTHLADCKSCQSVLSEIEELDRELVSLAKDPVAQRDWEVEELPKDDPFRRRPMSLRVAAAALSNPEHETAAFRSVAASEEGSALSTVVFDAAKKSQEDIRRVLSRLDLSDPAHRYALLYSLQEAGREIVLGPVRFLRLAEESLAKISAAQPDDSKSANPVPVASLFGQAHQLVGQACLWTGEFERSKSHLELSYQFFAQNGDEVSLAITELLESQRRSFSGHGSEGLGLARRALATFETFDLEDYVARILVVEGLALSSLGRYEEAIAEYRRALPVFEKLGLWSNFVGAVNSTATALVKLGRIDEARREYARALRRFSKEQQKSPAGFIRYGLAEVLFTAGRYREAAISLAQAARLFSECGLLLLRLKACLFEVENWARAGELARARRRLDAFVNEVSRLGAIEPTFAREFERALSGAQPDYERAAALRREATTLLEARLTQVSA